MTSEGRVAREGVPTAVTSGKRSKKQQQSENSLAVQWLGHGAFTAEGAGSIPGQGTKIPQAAAQPKKKGKEIGFFVLKSIDMLFFNFE